VLAFRAVSRGRIFQAARVVAAAILLAASLVPVVAGRAAGEESMSDLRAEMASLQAQLDAATRQIEGLRDSQERITHDIDRAERRIAVLRKKSVALQDEAIARARLLYQTGGTGTIELLFASQDISELATRAEMLSKVSLEDTSVFVVLARHRAEEDALTERLREKREEQGAVADRLSKVVEALQGKFESISSRYEELKDKLAAAVSTPGARVNFSGSMACPVAGPVSFTDTYGAPRAGHTHQGVDMMGAYGTPIVAITSGTITYSGYGSSAGYWLILSGDDGNQYWYMHNQQNTVSGGHVETGQQIATLGDSGNAAGTPHLHFEFHPGGGGAVNPTPLVASIC